MQRHFHDDLAKLKQKLLAMGSMVEAAIQQSVRSVIERKGDFAEKVFASEKQINQTEIEIDTEGHSLFAIGQPMAADLRLITMILKINTDLERMGDHAVNIAENALALMKEPPLKIDVHLPEMAKASQNMVRDSLEAFMKGDATLARNVLQRDDEVDAFNDSLRTELTRIMEGNPNSVKAGLNLVSVGHNLERIADLANNIAEDVIYMKQGKEVRHHIEELPSS